MHKNVFMPSLHFCAYRGILENREKQRKRAEIYMINFAIIGTNFVTDSFLDATSKCENAQVIAVYSRSLDKAKKYAKKCGAKLVFDDLEKMAKCEEIDAVYVASPNSLHAQQSILMMQHKKHVLCEKTIASNEKEFMAMRDTAYKNEVVLLEAMRSAQDPGFLKIKELLPKLGNIRRATFRKCQYSRRYDKFKSGTIENAFNPQLSNAALMDIGVYCVHPMVTLFGVPKRIKSISLKLDNGFEASGTTLLDYEDMLAEVIYSKITASQIPSEIQGEKAVLLIDEIADPCRLTIIYNNGEKEEISVEKEDNNMCYEVREFVKLVENHSIHHPYLYNSKMEILVMDEIRRQEHIIFPADGE